MKEEALLASAIMTLYILGIPIVITIGLFSIGFPFNQTLNLLVLAMIILYAVEYPLAPLLIKSEWGLKPIDEFPLPKEKKEAIIDAVERHLNDVKKKVKIFVAEKDIPNAFALSHPIFGHWVVVTRRLVEELDEKELRAVVLHELGHRRHKDSYIMLAILFPAIFIEGLMLLSIWRIIFKSESDNEWDVVTLDVIFGFILIPIYLAMLVMFCYFSRRRERRADLFSKEKIGDGIPLATALIKIHNIMAREERVRKKAKSSIINPLFFANPITKEEIPISVGLPEKWVREILKAIALKPEKKTSIFSTHPNICERVAYLID